MLSDECAKYTPLIGWRNLASLVPDCSVLPDPDDAFKAGAWPDLPENLNCPVPVLVLPTGGI